MCPPHDSVVVHTFGIMLQIIALYGNTLSAYCLQNFFPHPHCQQEMLYESIINITPHSKYQTGFLLLSIYF